MFLHIFQPIFVVAGFPSYTSHARTRPKPFTPAVTSSLLQPKLFPTPETEALEPDLPLQAQLERAARLGPKFDQIQILSPERSEPRLSPRIQRSAAIGVLGGGALAGAATTATGTAGTAATGGLAAGAGVSGGLVLVGTFAVGGTLVLGVYALGAMTSVPSGDPETWPQPNPQPGPPPQAPGQRLKVAPLPPGQDLSELPTYTQEQLGVTQAEAMRFVSQESIPGQNPTGIREDLIPMTGDLPGQVEGMPMEQPRAQVLGEDPVRGIPTQLPGYMNGGEQQFADDYILEATRLPRSEGKWSGDPGNSDWISTNSDVNSVTKDKPISFTNGYPDFTLWSQGNVSIAGMTGENADDFAEADRLFAQQQGWLRKNGQPNAAESRRYRRSNRLTWHHHQDGNTMQLIPMPLHGNIPHVGGASEARSLQSPQI